MKLRDFTNRINFNDVIEIREFLIDDGGIRPWFKWYHGDMIDFDHLVYHSLSGDMGNLLNNYNIAHINMGPGYYIIYVYDIRTIDETFDEEELLEYIDYAA